MGVIELLDFRVRGRGDHWEAGDFSVCYGDQQKDGSLERFHHSGKTLGIGASHTFQGMKPLHPEGGGLDRCGKKGERVVIASAGGFGDTLERTITA